MVQNGRAEPGEVSLLWRAPVYVVTDMLVFWWLPALAVACIVGAAAAASTKLRQHR